MYAQEKESARLDFVQRFRWNNEDGVLLRVREDDTRPCCMRECEQPATQVLFDYEDESSGGYPMCDEHASELVYENGKPESWVSQDPEEAWNGVREAAGNGWSRLWFLFAPVGTYAKDGAWPYEEERS